MAASTRLTFAELAARLYYECGFQGAAPTTALNQIGRNRMVFLWINRAWLQIQQRKKNWRWMRETVNFTLTEDDHDYTIANLSIDYATVSKTAWGDWLIDKRPGYHSGWTIQDITDSDPASTTGPLQYVGWDNYRRNYRNRTVTKTRPYGFTVMPNGTVYFIEAPDASATWRVYADYYHAPWVFLLDGTDDANYPDLPEDHHELIVGWALKYFAIKENAPEYYRGWNDIVDEQFHDLLTRELDQVHGTEELTSFASAAPIA